MQILPLLDAVLQLPPPRTDPLVPERRLFLKLLVHCLSAAVHFIRALYLARQQRRPHLGNEALRQVSTCGAPGTFYVKRFN